MPEHSVEKEGSFYSFQTVVLFQKIVPELEPDYGRKMRRIISLGDDKYAEERFDPRGQEALSLYETASDYFIFGKGDSPHSASKDPWGIWALGTCKDFTPADWRSPAIRELAVGFNTYTENTSEFGQGEVLDMEGLNNIIFYPETSDQDADFILVDALYPFSKYPSLIIPLTINRIRTLLFKANQDTMPEFTNPEKAQLMNGVNYLRHANAIIDFNGSDISPLHIFRGNESWRPDIWQRVFTLSREFLERER